MRWGKLEICISVPGFARILPNWLVKTMKPGLIQNQAIHYSTGVAKALLLSQSQSSCAERQLSAHCEQTFREYWVVPYSEEGYCNVAIQPHLRQPYYEFNSSQDLFFLFSAAGKHTRTGVRPGTLKPAPEFRSLRFPRAGDIGMHQCA